MNADRAEKLDAIRSAASYRPDLGAAIVTLSLLTALLEGIGVGFILPIVEFTQSATPNENPGGLLRYFVRAYEFLGVPFTFEYLLLGVASVMTVRFSISFLVGWLRGILTTGYQRQLREELFEAISYAPIEYIDKRGSDDLINSLVTEANRAGGIVYGLLSLVEGVLRGFIYLVIAGLLSLELTLVALIGLGTSTLFVRYVLEPAYTAGNELADINSRLQTLSQTGVQGARDMRLYNHRSELLDQMRDKLGQHFDARVRLTRNQSALENLNQLTNALVVFALIYVGVRFTSLSFGEIGVFLFAVFRLSPTLTQLNNTLYRIDGILPHLIRVQKRLEELDDIMHPAARGDRSIDSVSEVVFEDVSFSYGASESDSATDPGGMADVDVESDARVLRDVSFKVERGEHISLVGQSGAGKSTTVALLGRLQAPDSGRILADGTPIEEFNIEQWRARLAVVRQNPYILSDTLWENVTLGDREVSREAVERVCEIAQVTEFLDDLADGYETELGDEGARLSGGQKQRISIARALLRDADVLVLDEATSELDSNIEQDVHDGIREMDDSYATISIAHRLSSVVDADRIYTLEGGTVVESGTHRELIAGNGVYADLYANQS